MSLVFVKSDIPGLPRQPLFPVAAAFCSSGLLPIQDHSAHGAVGKAKQLVHEPPLAPAPQTPGWDT